MSGRLEGKVCVITGTGGSMGRRLRVLSAWINAAISGPQVSELGLVDERYATIQAEAENGYEP